MIGEGSTSVTSNVAGLIDPGGLAVEARFEYARGAEPGWAGRRFNFSTSSSTTAREALRVGHKTVSSTSERKYAKMRVRLDKNELSFYPFCNVVFFFFRRTRLRGRGEND